MRRIIVNSSESLDSEKYYISNLVKSIKVIPLEAMDQAIFEWFQSIHIADSLIYVFDDLQTKGIHLYNFKGEHLRSLRNLGRGPGEYINPVAFDIDVEDSTCIILDAAGGKLLFYHLTEFSHKRSISLPKGKRFSYFVKSDDDFYLFGDYSEHPDQEYLVYKINEKGEILCRLFSYSDFLSSGHKGGRNIYDKLVKTRNGVVLVQGTSNSLLSIRECNSKEFLSLHSDKDVLKKTQRRSIPANNQIDKNRPKTQQDNNIQIVSYSSNLTHQMIQYRAGESHFYCILKEDATESINVNRRLLIDDITGMRSNELYKIEGNWIIGVVYPINIPGFIEKIEGNSGWITQDEKEHLLGKYKTITRDGVPDFNPTIVLYELK